MKLAICGAAGKMGLAVARLAKAEGATIVGAIDRGEAARGKDIGELAGIGTAGVVVAPEIASGLLGAEVVIDFSRPQAIPELARAAARAKVALVSGTTGLDADAERALDEAAKIVPVLWAPNMSVGVHVLAEIVTRAVKMLGAEFDVEVVEAHHNAKVDAPSGTAKRLVAAAVAGRSSLIREVRGRDGNDCKRKSDEIGVHAIRGGDVIGDHTVHLLGHGERLELTHRATSRDLFARGALRAARFVSGKPARRYTIADVVG